MHPANGSLLLKEDSWPADARWVLTEFLMSEEGAQRGSVTPRFILVQNEKIILTVTGNAAYKEKMWPKILEITG